MRIEYQDYILEMEGEKGSQELTFALYHNNTDIKVETMLWNGILMGMWKNDYERETEELIRIWDLHNEGDYFQQTISKTNKDFIRHTSFTAIFQEIIRNKRDEFSLIKNLYSTSTNEWLSFGYHIYPQATKFWEKQVENGFAEWVGNEKRYKAILE
jgi:hypothetical protein